MPIRFPTRYVKDGDYYVKYSVDYTDVIHEKSDEYRLIQNALESIKLKSPDQAEKINATRELFEQLMLTRDLTNNEMVEKVGFVLLTEAIYAGNVDAVKLLLDMGVDVNEKSRGGSGMVLFSLVDKKRRKNHLPIETRTEILEVIFQKFENDDQRREFLQETNLDDVNVLEYAFRNGDHDLLNLFTKKTGLKFDREDLKNITKKLMIYRGNWVFPSSFGSAIVGNDITEESILTYLLNKNRVHENDSQKVNEIRSESQEVIGKVIDYVDKKLRDLVNSDEGKDMYNHLLKIIEHRATTIWNAGYHKNFAYLPPETIYEHIMDQLKIGFNTSDMEYNEILTKFADVFTVDDFGGDEGIKDLVKNKILDSIIRHYTTPIAEEVRKDAESLVVFYDSDHRSKDIFKLNNVNNKLSIYLRVFESSEKYSEKISDLIISSFYYITEEIKNNKDPSKKQELELTLDKMAEKILLFQEKHGEMIFSKPVSDLYESCIKPDEPKKSVFGTIANAINRALSKKGKKSSDDKSFLQDEPESEPAAASADGEMVRPTTPLSEREQADLDELLESLGLKEKELIDLNPPREDPLEENRKRTEAIVIEQRRRIEAQEKADEKFTKEQLAREKAAFEERQNEKAAAEKERQRVADLEREFAALEPTPQHVPTPDPHRNAAAAEPVQQPRNRVLARPI